MSGRNAEDGERETNVEADFTKRISRRIGETLTEMSSPRGSHAVL